MSPEVGTLINLILRTSASGSEWFSVLPKVTQVVND